MATRGYHVERLMTLLKTLPLTAMVRILNETREPGYFCLHANQFREFVNIYFESQDESPLKHTDQRFPWA